MHITRCGNVITASFNGAAISTIKTIPSLNIIPHFIVRTIVWDYDLNEALVLSVADTVAFIQLQPAWAAYEGHDTDKIHGEVVYIV